MRRWLAILLLVLLPFQATWAAAAGYCGHETGMAASHFGHHEHAAHGHAPQDAGAETQDSPADGTASGIDCGHCHGHCAGIVAGAPVAAQHSRADLQPGAAALTCPDPAPAQPERPQWVRLA